MKGWGSKSSVCPSKPGIFPGAPGKFEKTKKSLCSIRATPCLLTLWESETVAANRVAASTIRTRYGNSASNPGSHSLGLAKPSRILSKREAHTEFQYRPRIVDTDTIADTVFADAISETSIPLFKPQIRSDFLPP